MITANEARELYQQPPYTAEEVEEQIRRTAASRGWTCFDKSRFDPTMKRVLENDYGYKFSESGDDYIVSWEQKAEAA